MTRSLVLGLVLLGFGCASTASAGDAGADVSGGDAAAPQCAAGMVFVYDPGCAAPTGRCVVEITDAGTTVEPSFCGCDGVSFLDNTGARRPIRALGFCPTPTVDAGVDVTAIDVGTDATTLDVGVDVTAVDAEIGPDCGDLMLDPRNCGGCGVVCCGGWCLNGTCGTEGPPGTTGCPSTEEFRLANGCVGPVPRQLYSDPSNCGACGASCDGGVCASGLCSP